MRAQTCATRKPQSNYTIMLEFRKQYYLSQVTAGSLEVALRRWGRGIQNGDLQAGAKIAYAFLEDELWGHPVPLNGLRHAWCQTAMVGKHHAIINIVRTSSVPPITTGSSSLRRRRRRV